MSEDTHYEPGTPHAAAPAREPLEPERYSDSLESLDSLDSLDSPESLDSSDLLDALDASESSPASGPSAASDSPDSPAAPDAAAAPRPSRSLYRIGEVSRIAETKPFVLRYWETEFPMLQPVKSPKGHRLYRQQDVDTVLLIKRLLYDEGFTIAGARRHLREAGAAAPGEAALSSARASIDSENSAPLVSENLWDSRPVEPAAAQTLSGGRLNPAAPVPIDRKVLEDLRDSLRAFLTLLESE